MCALAGGRADRDARLLAVHGQPGEGGRQVDRCLHLDAQLPQPARQGARSLITHPNPRAPMQRDEIRSATRRAPTSTSPPPSSPPWHPPSAVCPRRTSTSRSGRRSMRTRPTRTSTSTSTRRGLIRTCPAYSSGIDRRICVAQVPAFTEKAHSIALSDEMVAAAKRLHGN